MRARDKRSRSLRKRHQPRGLRILHEDRDIIVVDKVSGLLTMSSAEVKDRTAYAFLNDYVRKGVQKSRNRIFIVHRLDRETSGVLVFAKHEEAKRFLQDAWFGFRKQYVAVVHGKPPNSEGVVESYLAENGVHRVYSVADPKKGRLARTGYTVLKDSPTHSLLEIELMTGRKHQIRVHLSDLGCPVVGDKKYGSDEKGLGIKRLALHAISMTIAHPHSKQMMTFAAEIPIYFASLVKETPA